VDKIGAHVAMRLSALRARRTFTTRKIPGTHFCSRLNRSKVITRLEGLGQWNHTEHTDTHCVQNLEFYYFETGGKYSDLWAKKW
jgi:hypothetical protein